MNKLNLLGLFTFFLSLFLSTSSFAQISKCCGNVIVPEVQSGTGSAIAINSTTAAPILSIFPAGFPNTEFIITKRGTLAGSNPNGDVIVGTSVDGIFVPATQSRYGVSLAVGDVMDVTAVGYDLSQQKKLVDSLLNGKTNGTPCCALFPTLAAVQKQSDPSFTVADSIALANFCDTLRSYNINGANDISSFNEVLFTIERFSSNYPSSIESFVDGMNLINSNGIYISTDCGGLGSNDFLKYGINVSKRAGTPLSIATSVVERLSPVSNFAIVPNPAQGQATLLISSKETMNLNITVFNTLGEQVQTQQQKAIIGNQQIQLDLSQLTPNIYFVELNDGQNRIVKKIVVQ